jgi:hypothetical protein
MPGISSRNSPNPPLYQREAVKKLIWFFLASFRRKPESRFFTDLRIDWTPVFTGVTNEFQFFHSFRGARGIFFGDLIGALADQLMSTFESLTINRPPTRNRNGSVRQSIMEWLSGCHESRKEDDFYETKPTECNRTARCHATRGTSTPG